MFNYLLLVIFFFCINCGVKGKPLPPIEPPEIGDGRPRYEGAQEEIKKANENEDERNKSSRKSNP